MIKPKTLSLRPGCTAESSVDSVNWPESFPVKPSVEVFVSYDAEALTVRFEVVETDVKAVYSNDLDPVWEDSCVEFFVLCADGKHYCNFELNCIGALLASRRLSRDDYAYFTPDELARVERKTSLPSRKAVLVEGESRWSASMRIPFDLLGFDSVPESLAVNFYKCGDCTDHPHYLSWSPITTPAPDFHRPEFFGRLNFMK